MDWFGITTSAFLFTKINPAAWLFAALFVAQAVLLLRAGRQRRPAAVLLQVETDYVLLAAGVLLIAAMAWQWSSTRFRRGDPAAIARRD